MANVIRIKRSAVQGRVPNTAQLDLGELAVNTYDGLLYLKKNVGGTESIVQVNGAAAGEPVTKIPFYLASGSASPISQILAANVSYVPFVLAGGTTANIPMVL